MFTLVRNVRNLRPVNSKCNIKFSSDVGKGVYQQQIVENLSDDNDTSSLFDISTPTIRDDIIKNMAIHEKFLSPEEEQSLLSELEPYMKKLRYEFDHWDNAIHGYRETEKLHWNKNNNIILDRIRKLAFSSNETTPLQYIHVLDLAKNGYIKPHVDSVRFCGSTITGLSLLSSSVMRLLHEKQPQLKADVLLPRYSLYIMKNVVRYDYTHEILDDKTSWHRGRHIPRERRISIMCRNEPTRDDDQA